MDCGLKNDEFERPEGPIQHLAIVTRDVCAALPPPAAPYGGLKLS